MEHKEFETVKLRALFLRSLILEMYRSLHKVAAGNCHNRYPVPQFRALRVSAGTMAHVQII